MTLEDFFTLTEMKDGLTAPARVEELVTVMQKEKDCVVKNVGDATRQWSTVASTIAATENKDCLDLFIQLDGLLFINRWLKDAQKFGNDPSDSFVEESITALLRALEKLNIDNEKLTSSGIWATVKDLLGHDSSRIQDRARALFDGWKQGNDGDVVHQDAEKVGALCDGGIIVSAKPTCESGLPECSAMDISLSKEIANVETHAADAARDEILQSTSDGVGRDRSETAEIQTSNNQVNSDITLDHADMEDESADPPPHSVMLNPVQENNLPIKEESPLREGTTIIKACSSIPAEGKVEGNSGVPKVKEFADDVKQMHEMNSSPDHLDKEFSPTSTTMEPRAVSSSGASAPAGKPMMEPASQNVIDAKSSDFSEKSRTLGSEPESGKDDFGALSHYKSTFARKATGEGGESCSNVSQDGNDGTLGKSEDPETSFSRMEDIGAINEEQEHASDGCENVADASDFSRLAIESKGSDMNDKKSDIELEYGMVDPLELARRVAKEVERQVGDCREPFCSSSSEKISDGGIRLPDSPDSINGKQHQPMDGPPSEVPGGQITPVEASSKKEHLNLQNLDVEPENFLPDVESSLVTESMQGQEVNTEKGVCDFDLNHFDLNQEIFPEDMDRPVNPISTPVAVVSASRATAAPGLPVSPLQFEGTRGWKGSAATSAFRPASPRRVPDAGKTLLIGETSNSSKQKQLFDFDLNVVEGGDDGDLMFPASSGFPSGESSVEVSPKRSDRLNWDLNRVSNEGDALPADWKIEGLNVHHWNGHRSPSPAFSSSSSMQSSMRNIDLNDRPSFQNNSSDLQPKQDEPVISLLGARVGVNRKTVTPHQTPSFQPNGKAPMTAVDANLGRTGGGILGLGPQAASYLHSHHVLGGYNGLAAAATGAPISFSSPIYVPGGGGSVPYMVDSRGAPVIPQIMGSAPPSTAVNANPNPNPSYSQPPFLMTMGGAPSGMNGAGAGGFSRHSFDLNSGFIVDGGNRDTGGLVSRQLFIPGQSEQLRGNLQPSSSAGKRKEPDSGWESSYPLNYKHHHQPPWK